MRTVVLVIIVTLTTSIMSSEPFRLRWKFGPERIITNTLAVDDTPITISALIAGEARRAGSIILHRHLTQLPSSLIHLILAYTIRESHMPSLFSNLPCSAIYPFSEFSLPSQAGLFFLTCNKNYKSDPLILCDVTESDLTPVIPPSPTDPWRHEQVRIRLSQISTSDSQQEIADPMGRFRTTIHNDELLLSYANSPHSYAVACTIYKNIVPIYRAFYRWNKQSYVLVVAANSNEHENITAILRYKIIEDLKIPHNPKLAVQLVNKQILNENMGEFHLAIPADTTGTFAYYTIEWSQKLSWLMLSKHALKKPVIIFDYGNSNSQFLYHHASNHGYTGHWMLVPSAYKLQPDNRYDPQLSDIIYTGGNRNFSWKLATADTLPGGAFPDISILPCRQKLTSSRLSNAQRIAKLYTFGITMITALGSIQLGSYIRCTYQKHKPMRIIGNAMKLGGCTMAIAASIRLYRSQARSVSCSI